MSTLDTRINQLEMQLQTLEGTATAVARQLGVLMFLRVDELSGDTDRKGFEDLIGHLACELDESVERSAEIRSASLKGQEAEQ